MSDILITVIHPTARTKPTSAFPEGWREAARIAYERADNPEQIQYLLAVHKIRIDDVKGSRRGAGGWSDFTVICNDNRDCGVDQVNACMSEVRGKLVVILHDDMFPPQGWDTLLLDLFRDQSGALVDLDRDAAVHVSSGKLTAAGWELPMRNDELFNPQVLTFARAKRLGYFGYPEYESMYSDDEFSEHARRDGVVIDARHIVFEHRHPIFGGEIDKVYHQENSQDAYRQGCELLRRRRAAGFPSLAQADPGSSRRLIGVCLPGQMFSNLWVDSWTKLFGHLITNGWNVVNLFGYSTSVHVSRMSMADYMSKVEPKPDFFLWIDDDNLLSIDQFNLLVAGLEAAEKEDPNVQMVAGWCWMKCEDLDAEKKISCGWTQADREGKTGNVALPYEVMMGEPHELIEIEWTGFPVVLMRPAAIDRAGGPGAFLPYLDPDVPFGFLGEDMAFSRRFREAGGRMLVHRGVKVPHLKLQPAEPRGSGAPRVSESIENLAV